MTVTSVIIIITIVVSYLGFGNLRLFDDLKLFPALMHSPANWYRAFTYAFIHADWIHLCLNMFVLYNFGSNGTELYYHFIFEEKGALYFILLYVGGIIGSVIPTIEKQKNNPLYTAVGASGAVSSVVFAYIVFNPKQSFYLFFIPVPIPAFLFGIVYLLVSYYLAKKDQGSVAHDAHLFGSLFGLMFTILLRPSLFLEMIAKIRS